MFMQYKQLEFSFIFYRVWGCELVQIADFRAENNLKTGDVIQCRECGYGILRVAYALRARVGLDQFILLIFLKSRINFLV
jgi:hypothetical protein